MKNIFLLVVVFLLSLTSCSQNSKTAKSGFQKYPFKSAVIEYTITGNSTGTKTIYIDDYGFKQAEISEITTKIMGFKTKEKEEVITVGSEIFTVDHETNKVVKTNNPYAEKYAENVGEDYIKTGEEVLISLGFEKIGNETILGKNCTIWKGMSTIWAWKGVVLKSETNLMGMRIVETATSIKTAVNIDADKFIAPTNYAVEEIEMAGANNVFSEFENANESLTDEDKKMMKEVQKMSFEDFKKMMKKEDPEISDEEIKNVYRMMKTFGNN
ncbi:hypothetical protein ACFQ5N_03200 [Lutibacter holmesii]|uniref:DUF4412 domain-containing protein n=1 Tax=Lutibacter holmesii TaxID=1137985 RepID=A0ABW3WL07_9FLAO